MVKPPTHRKSRYAPAVVTKNDLLELLEPHVPSVDPTPIEKLGYANSGIHELAIVTTNLDKFFDKVKSMGYKTQTEYVWNSGNLGRSFVRAHESWEGSRQLLDRDAADPFVAGRAPGPAGRRNTCRQHQWCQCSPEIHLAPTMLAGTILARHDLLGEAGGDWFWSLR